MYKELIVSSSTSNLNEISELERDVGFVFPLSFVAFVEKFNGAQFEDAEIASSGGHLGIRGFIPVNALIEINSELGNDALCAFAEDESGNFFVFVKGEGAAVYFLDHETNELESVSTNFETFLDSIAKYAGDQDHELQNVDVWIDPDFLESLKRD